MPDYLIYHMPGACSRVVLNALEEAGLAYKDQGVALLRGAQRSPDYLSINPKGKVPVLLAGGEVLTELPVIILHLAKAHPEAELLPREKLETEALSDLIWIAGALHPLASRSMRPAAIAPNDPEGVRSVAFEQLADHARRINERLRKAPFWYGDRWSIVDMFLAWVFDLAAQLGFAREEFPALAAHAQRIEARPSFVRARERELEAVGRDDLPLPPILQL